MTIPAEVYEAAAARLAITDALAPLALLHQMDYEPAIRQIREAAEAMVDRVWPLAEAAIRAEVAAEIRAAEPPKVATTRGTYTTSYGPREWAAQIAEGGAA